MIKRWRRWQDWYVLGLGLAILAISCLIYLGHLSFLPLVFQRLEALAYDLRMRLTVQETVQSNPPILIVDIDERSLLAEGQWPWSRYKLAKLVEQLHTAGAAVIAFDMTFPEPELNPLDEIKERLGSDFTLAPDLSSQYTRLDGDAHFAQAMQGRNVVLGSLFHQTDSFQKGSLQKTAVTWSAQAIPNTALLMHGYTANLSKLTEAASLSGFLNIFPDDDGVIRSAPLVMEFNQQLYPSLALQAVRQYLDEANQSINLLTAKVGEFEVITQLEFAGKVIRTDASGQITIPFLGQSGQFKFISATDILQQPVSAQFTDAIVLIGTSAKGLADLRSTPFQPGFPGVEAQATLIYALLNPALIPVVPEWLDAFVVLELLFLGFAMLWFYPYLQPYGMLIFGTVLGFLVIGLNTWLWSIAHLNTPLLPPLLLVLVMSLLFGLERLINEHQQRQRIQDMFGQYVPAEHIDQLLTNRRLNASMQGERREMTVLFSDIRQFTPLAEQLSTTQVQRFLNAYLTPLTSIIFQHQGTVDKYVGDMIMAFWGAPLPDTAHAEHAVLAALAMQQALDTMQPPFAELGLQQPLKAGIGVHSGEMTVGDMGSAYRRAYTVLGDAVNLGARLQELTKYYQVYTLTSLETVNQCPDLSFQLIDYARVRGRQEPVMIYQPLGKSSALSQSEQIHLAEHEQAMQLYLQGLWQQAKPLFEELNQSYPSQHYQLILGRMQANDYHAPKDWEGIINLVDL
ncbi:MAG: adenylate/guanylate cyclase domain-containing protein [Thiothrix sp.]|nr:MAG: adenylate/guanylate cyclase domain-containing protein [Thiothrix sp.]